MLTLGLDYGLTHSCYDPRPDGRPCGRCDSCRLRAKGFSEAGIVAGLRVAVRGPRDRASLLHRPVSDRVRRPASSTSATLDGRHGGRPRSHRVLPDVRRPAVRHRHARRRPRRRRRRSTTTARSCTSSRADPAAAAVSTGAGRSTGRGASSTCSSTPGSTCCRRRSIGCCGVRTESFHLGVGGVDDRSRARGDGWPRSPRAEDAANAVVWEDRPVTIRFVDAEDARALPLRKESARTGTLRIIEVEGFDVSACGGTHVARTGAIGVIAVSGWERFRGGTRLEFLCGVRALRAHRLLRDTVARRHPAAVGRRRGAAAGHRAAAGREQGTRGAASKDLESRLAALRGRRARRRGPTTSAACGVVARGGAGSRHERPQDDRAEHRRAAGPCRRPAARPRAVVGGRRARRRTCRWTLRALLKQLIARFGGKGGGRPELAQGGGLHARARGDPRGRADRCLTLILARLPPMPATCCCSLTIARPASRATSVVLVASPPFSAPASPAPRPRSNEPSAVAEATPHLRAPGPTSPRSAPGPLRPRACVDDAQVGRRDGPHALVAILHAVR